MAITTAAPAKTPPGPVAHNDIVTEITADTSMPSFIIQASQLLANDTKLAGAANAIHIQSVAGAGSNNIKSVSLNNDGNVVVTPIDPYHPSDSFSYTIVDGRGNTSSATVDVNWTVANNPPIISGPGSIDMPAPTNGIPIVDVPLSALLANVSDPDGDVVSISGIGAFTGGGHVGEDPYMPSLQLIPLKGILEFSNLTGSLLAGDSVSFNYVATDDASLSAIGSFTINIV